MTLRQKALEIIISQVGQKENPLGSNWGHPVKDYLKAVGIGFPASWCAALVYWSFEAAAAELGVINPVPKTGGVLDLLHKSSGFKVTGEPEAGDVFIMDHGHGLGHCGMVEIPGTITVNTVDGNTNDTGSREGIEVERKVRKRSSIVAYLRFS